MSKSIKILFIEDTQVFIDQCLKELNFIGDVTHFKSSNSAIRELGLEEGCKYDIVVCDHNINRFEIEDNTVATGDEIYMHLRMWNESDVPFLHFSADPCPDKYSCMGKDINFYSLHKTYNSDLFNKVMDILEK